MSLKELRDLEKGLERQRKQIENPGASESLLRELKIYDLFVPKEDPRLQKRVLVR
nr:hypothetical protein [uncultured Dyadobacter sp.]